MFWSKKLIWFGTFGSLHFKNVVDSVLEFWFSKFGSIDLDGIFGLVPKEQNLF